MISRALPAIQPGAERLMEVPVHHSSQEEIESRWQTRHGTLLEVSIRVAPWEGEDGGRRGTILLVADLTSRRHAQQEQLALEIREKEARELAKAESRFRKLLEAAPDAIIEVDRQGRGRTTQAAPHWRRSIRGCMFASPANSMRTPHGKP